MYVFIVRRAEYLQLLNFTTLQTFFAVFTSQIHAANMKTSSKREWQARYIFVFRWEFAERRFNRFKNATS